MSTNTAVVGPPDYSAYVEALRADAPELAREVAGFTGMGAVLDWARRQGHDLRAIDFVTQDEFEYDFLLPLASDGRWLVFGVT
jgi:hypothetical protein